MYKPLKLNPCRVYRTFLGGKLLDNWRGIKGEDNHFPEDWIGSTVKARNPGRENYADEGYSYVTEIIDGKECLSMLKDIIEGDPVGMLGQAHVNRYGKETAVLVKLVDSSQRLTIQVHPATAAAKKFFNFPFGKTEAWYIVATRSIKGSEPYVLLGFKEGITRQKWLDVYRSQDIPAMIDLMHRVPVKPGDMIIVNSAVPHGMGEGVLFLEVQESCDITLRTEKTTPNGEPLTDELCTCGIGVENMMDLFDYTGISLQNLQDSWMVKPGTIADGKNYSVYELIGPETTDCFSVYELDCFGSGCDFDIPGFYILLVNKGNGILHSKAGDTILKQGETYFIPAGVKDITWQSENGMNLLLCCPPEIEADKRA